MQYVAEFAKEEPSEMRGLHFAVPVRDSAVNLLECGLRKKARGLADRAIVRPRTLACELKAPSFDVASRSLLLALDLSLGWSKNDRAHRVAPSGAHEHCHD
jgi:hypothetical protein